MVFQEQLKDFRDAYSRNYEEYQMIVGKRQQEIFEKETIQIVSVEQQKDKADFLSDQKVK